MKTRMVEQGVVATEEQVSNKIFTVPNVISFARLCLVPVYFFVLFAGYNIAATIIFAFAAATDFVDGQVARRTHSVSKLGKLLDPAVDTILMISGVVGAFAIGNLPLWIMVLIFARELFLLIGGSVLLSKFGISVAVIYPGKFATTFLFFGLAGLLLNTPLVPGLGLFSVSWLPGFGIEPVSWGIWCVYIGLALQIGVTVYYCIVAWKKLNNALHADNVKAS
ncbi:MULTISPECIES: CDP-alcohol phosphatidyltransferase family protein [unclassified Adlercreutzia]|uniref:CDP-alcohol phosphatidyltransferase family protein n=1 Tax=unclassified Adlercreutzia TaxID=2636013 RepID=UPI001F14E5E6|nr:MULTISPECIES: CDP-alcohol phosphatidyltransferase family protein [unclassified Adlercreutzia]